MAKRPLSAGWPGRAAAGLLLVLFLAGGAGAYVLQGAHVLDLMIGRLGKMRSLEVHQRVILYDDRLAQGQAELSETVRYRLPDGFRSDLETEGTSRTHLRAGRSAATLLDGQMVSPAETPFDLYKDLLLYRNRETLEKRLARLGVDISVSSLGRFDGRIAFVIGARYPDETRSQVWIDKETFQPLRWLVRNPDDPPGTGVEIRYRNWAKNGPIQYPMQVLFFQDGRLVREIGAQRLGINPDFADDLFDMNALESRHRASVSDEATTDSGPKAEAPTGHEQGGKRSGTAPLAPPTDY